MTGEVGMSIVDDAAPTPRDARRLDADAAASSREHRLRAVFSNAADAMLVLDSGRVILDGNPAAHALFGEALLGERLDRFVIEDNASLQAAWHELETLGEVRREHRVSSPDGATRVVECSYRSLGQSGSYLCAARDITDRRLVEARLSHAEKIESVRRLAGGIAHDFNNLLTAILGHTELLLAEKPADDPDRRDLLQVQKASVRAVALTQQLLAFGRKQVLSPQDVDLNQVVSRLHSVFTRLIREDITLSYNLSSAPAIVSIDPAQLEQAILNLVLNARDAMPAGGEIRVEVARVPRSQAGLSGDAQATAAEYVRLRIADNGTGMPPETRAHLFEPFFSTKESGEGVGLGLATVHGIVSQSHGSIAVESEPGRGSVFTMHFPAVHPTAGGLPASVDTLPAALETVLVVDDEAAVRAVMSSILQRQGYDVRVASAPAEAIAIFERHHTEIDLLISDVVMPGMNGPALAERLAAVQPALRVLFISGYADVACPPDVGVNHGFLSKPFQASTLVAKVREMLNRTPATS